MSRQRNKIIPENNFSESSDLLVLNQLSTFFSATIKDRGDGPLLDLIKSLGGWPVIIDSWSSDSYDLEELMANVTRIGYGSLWQFAVGPDASNNDNYIIQVSFLLIHPLTRLTGKCIINNTCVKFCPSQQCLYYLSLVLR